MPIVTSGSFLGPHWGLETDTARALYQGVVEPLRAEKGIVDAHTHLSVRQILENDPFANILAAMVIDADPRWPGCDHYITQLVAKRGVPGSLLHSPDAKPYEQWQAIAKVFPELVGNHVYTWAHMELKVLGIENTLISSETAESAPRTTLLMT